MPLVPLWMWHSSGWNLSLHKRLAHNHLGRARRRPIRVPLPFPAESGILTLQRWIPPPPILRPCRLAHRHMRARSAAKMTPGVFFSAVRYALPSGYVGENDSRSLFWVPLPSCAPPVLRGGARWQDGAVISRKVLLLRSRTYRAPRRGAQDGRDPCCRPVRGRGGPARPDFRRRNARK